MSTRQKNLKIKYKNLTKKYKNLFDEGYFLCYNYLADKKMSLPMFKNRQKDPFKCPAKKITVGIKGADLMNKIITVGREFGSGGRELARRLAENLNMDYYDKEIITEISKHTSLSEEYVKQVIEHRPHYLYPITTGQSISYVGEYAFQQVQTIYGAQSEIIKSMAEKSDCVIVGRCADYILRDYNPFRLFVYADIESRIKRCMERAAEGEKLTEKEMKRHILALDKERAKYYEFYTDRRWGDKLNYDLCINTSFLEIKKLVPEIAKLFK